MSLIGSYSPIPLSLVNIPDVCREVRPGDPHHLRRGGGQVSGKYCNWKLTPFGIQNKILTPANLSFVLILKHEMAQEQSEATCKV